MPPSKIFEAFNARAMLTFNQKFITIDSIIPLLLVHSSDGKKPGPPSYLLSPHLLRYICQSDLHSLGHLCPSSSCSTISKLFSSTTSFIIAHLFYMLQQKLTYFQRDLLLSSGSRFNRETFPAHPVWLTSWFYFSLRIRWLFSSLHSSPCVLV